MIEIIPAIIAKSFKELKEKIEQVEPYVKWVQIDVMDGDFVPNSTWNKPQDLKYYDPGVLLEAHLMISQPEKYVEQWIDAGIRRIIFHIEATVSPYEIMRVCRARGVEAGVAISPDTPVGIVENVAKRADMILVLGVTPGFGGQEFKSEVLEKIEALREANPRLTIEVDGGMNLKTAKRVVSAGANIIGAGSIRYNSQDIEDAIEKVRNIVKDE